MCVCWCGRNKCQISAMKAARHVCLPSKLHVICQMIKTNEAQKHSMKRRTAAYMNRSRYKSAPKVNVKKHNWQLAAAAGGWILTAKKSGSWNLTKQQVFSSNHIHIHRPFKSYIALCTPADYVKVRQKCALAVSKFASAARSCRFVTVNIGSGSWRVKCCYQP